MQRKVLIVDDENTIRDSLRLLLQTHFEVKTADDGDVAIDIIDHGFIPQIVLLDLHMPRLDGISTLKFIQDKKIGCHVIMLTAAGTVESAVEAMKIGAKDFLSKPFDIEALTNLMFSLLADGPLEQPGEITEAPNTSIIVHDPFTVDIKEDSHFMVGESEVMKSLFKKIEQVAPKDTTVLITGESGTGKELVAKKLHDASKRAQLPFIAINCAAIPESLIESELFGHEKGSFTGAHETRIGQFELASGGTLFLDEIGELSLQMQVKLLRVIQEQEFYRVGRSKAIKVDVRLIFATNRDLEQMVKLGQFRQDLYYRIHVISLEILPLRQRYEDIIPLINYFIQKLSLRYGGRILKFTAEAQESLLNYGWPGNVRELENIIESLLALAPSDTIDLNVLPKKLFTKDTQEFNSSMFEGSLKFDDAERKFESEMIIKALKRTNFVQTKAAELLGISRRILKYKMDKLGITEHVVD